ncbi:MAG: Mur ligase family protein [Bacteroidota bacterium]
MKVHFIAMGGSIMHSLAIALKKNGHEVSGSDDQIFDPARTRLMEEGLLPEEGWHIDRIHQGLDAIILGMHAFEDNPELKRALELNIPIYSFPEFVAKESAGKQRIVITGSAGKTTITSMIMHVLKKMGKNFDYMVGAQVAGFENPVRISQDAPVIIIEGDEYLSSRIDKKPKFLHYHPHTLVVSNISWDHINVFPSEQIYVEQFEKLVNGLEKASSVVYFEEDPKVKDVVEAQTDTEIHYLIPYSIPEYDVKEDGFYLSLGNEKGLMSVIGAHNMANIHAAWKVCELLSVEAKDFIIHISTFIGAGIRLETIKEEQGKIVIRDYAHAPSKVMASVDAVKSRYPSKNVIACLELHTFSSLNKEFIPHYHESLKPADKKLVFVDPKAIQKKRMEPLKEDFIKSSFGEEHLNFVESKDEIEAFLADNASGNDVFLMMSSGNFSGLDLHNL